MVEIKTDTNLIQHMRNMAELKSRCYGIDLDLAYRSFEALILDNGCEYDVSPDIPDWLDYGIPKQCYSNCYEAVLNNPADLTYCEGYYTDDSIPIVIFHAWVLSNDGFAYDLTLHADDRPNGQYFGIAFDIGFVTHRLNETECFSVFETDYMFDYPLLERGMPQGSVLDFVT